MLTARALLPLHCHTLQCSLHAAILSATLTMLVGTLLQMLLTLNIRIAHTAPSAFHSVRSRGCPFSQLPCLTAALSHSYFTAALCHSYFTAALCHSYFTTALSHSYFTAALSHRHWISS